MQQQKKRNIKFIYSEKATRIWLSNVKTKRKISSNVCGLLRKPELYSLYSDLIIRFVRVWSQDLSKCHVNSVQAFARIRINKQWIQNLLILHLNSYNCNCDFDIFFFVKNKPAHEVFVIQTWLFWRDFLEKPNS